MGRVCSGIGDWVQILALPLSLSLQRLKRSQHPSSLSLWNPCVGICRHSFGAKRQRTVAFVCRSRYLLTDPTGGEDGGQGPGNPGVVHNQEGFAPEDYETAAAKELVLQRDSGTIARAVDL